MDTAQEIPQQRQCLLEVGFRQPAAGAFEELRFGTGKGAQTVLCGSLSIPAPADRRIAVTDDFRRAPYHAPVRPKPRSVQ